MPFWRCASLRQAVVAALVLRLTCCAEGCGERRFYTRDDERLLRVAIVAEAEFDVTNRLHRELTDLHITSDDIECVTGASTFCSTR